MEKARTHRSAAKWSAIKRHTWALPDRRRSTDHGPMFSTGDGRTVHVHNAVLKTRATRARMTKVEDQHAVGSCRCSFKGPSEQSPLSLDNSNWHRSSQSLPPHSKENQIFSGYDSTLLAPHVRYNLCMDRSQPFWITDFKEKTKTSRLVLSVPMLCEITKLSVLLDFQYVMAV